jgi:hypothetical protein
MFYYIIYNKSKIKKMCILCFNLETLEKNKSTNDEYIKAFNYLIDYDKQVINLYNCTKIKVLSSLVYIGIKKNNIERRIYTKNFKLITEINLYKLDNLVSLPTELDNLEILHICDVPNLLSLPLEYKNLHELKIINSRIKTIPKTYHKLKDLYLQDTQIRVLSKDYINLERLTLNFTPVSKLEYYPKLYYLLLFRTNITTIQKEYKPNLKELNISSSKNFELDPHVSVLPEYLTNLEKLYASVSTITRVPETYVNLKTLLLYQSDVKELSPNFYKLEYLDCSKTQITSIPKEYVRLLELTYSDDKTTWDNSWYKDDDDILQIIKLQRWYLTKKYLYKLNSNKKELMMKYKRYRRKKAIKVLQQWFIKTINYLLYIKTLKQNKQNILNQYLVYNNHKLKSLVKIQQNFKKVLIMQKIIQHIQNNKQNLNKYYLNSIYKKKISINKIIKWYKRIKFINLYLKNIKTTRSSIIRSYKYYIRDKNNGKIVSKLKNYNLVNNKTKITFNKNQYSINLSKILTKFYINYKQRKFVKSFNNVFYIYKKNKCEFTLTNNLKKNQNYTFKFKSNDDIKTIKNKIKNYGINIKYNNIYSNIYNIIDIIPIIGIFIFN